MGRCEGVQNHSVTHNQFSQRDHNGTAINHRIESIMAIYQLKQSIKRRLFGSKASEVKQPTPAPIPEGFEIVQPDPKPKAQQAPVKAPATEATPRTIEAPKVEASTELPKAAPKVELPQAPKASASESVAPMKAAETRTIITQPSIATTRTVKPAAGKVVMLGRFKLQSGQFSTVREQPGPARDHFRMIGEIAQAAAPFDSVFTPRTPVKTLFVTWNDADTTLRKIVRTSGNPRLRQASDVRHWSDNIGVLSLNHTLDERFTLDSIRSELKKGKWDACIIWDERECLESFSGSETRMNSGLSGVAEDSGVALAFYRPL